MNRRSRPDRAQSALFPLVAVVHAIATETTAAVLDALADLLLEASGRVPEREGVDNEFEDHA